MDWAVLARKIPFFFEVEMSDSTPRSPKTGQSAIGPEPDANMKG
jgi:hypothetical protein